MDSFLERALSLVKRGIHVFPVAPGILGDDKSGKNPLTENGVDDATLDRKKLNEWHAKWPTANVGCAPVGKGFLDDDNGDLAERYEKETGDKFPRTFTVLTSVNGSGLRKKHHYFDSDETTILLGNRKASSPEGGERFSFREHGLYVVGPGSVHWTGAVYTAEDEKAPFALMGKKLANWLEQNSEMEKSKTHGGEGPIAHADWNPDKWMEFYEDAFTCGQDGEWWVSSVCPATYEGPGTGRKHEHSTKTGFRFGGAAPEFHCFAGGCPGSGMSFGDVVKHLNKYHEPYPGPIWKEEPIEQVLKAFDVVSADAIGKTEIPETLPETDESKIKEYELWKSEDGFEKMTAIRFSDAPMAPVDWLWKGRLPRGCGLVISGSVGTNKSMMSTDIAARITKGWDWPDGEKNDLGPREVLVAATEDDLHTTIKPRFVAAGGDCTKISFLKNVFACDEEGNLKSRELDINADIARLLKMLRANPQILLVILDPLTGFFGDMDGNDNKKIRPMMQKIAKVCRLTGVAFILLIHENKRGDANAVDKILGAGAVSQVIRAGVRISKDPRNKPDGRIMANIKGNLSRDNGGMKFSIGSKNLTAEDGRLLEDIGYIEWGEKHGMNADDVMDEERAFRREAMGADTKVEQAMNILRDALLEGPRLQRDVHKLLDAAKISDETKRRARRKLGIKGSRGYPWYWCLPEHELPGPTFEAEEPKIEDTGVM